MTPPVADHRPRPRLRLAADQVVDEVDVPGLVLEAFVLVIDDGVGPELADEFDVGGAGGGDDPRPGVAGELDGEVPDPAGGPVDQDGLARAEPAVGEQPLPCGQRGERHGGGGCEVDPGGHAGHLGRADGDELGERAAVGVEHGEDRIADLEPRRLDAARLDRAGEVAAHDQRQHVGADRRIMAVADLIVDRVEAGGDDADDDLVVDRLRPVDRVDADLLGAAEAVQAQRADRVGRHRRSPAVERTSRGRRRGSATTPVTRHRPCARCAP